MTPSVVFVCTGNICRSPTAEGVLRKMLADAGLGGGMCVDSAGTHGYHVGEAPDPRTRAAALRRGYDLSELRARQFERADFARFDLVLAMDRGHHAILTRLAEAAARPRVQMMTQYSRRYAGIDVPDPYYGGPDGFDHVLDIIEDAAQGLLEAVAMQGTPKPGTGP